jgi:GNAT superfamily N-acetyltransferase
VVSIREAVVDDVPVIYAMLAKSALDQGCPDSLGVTENDVKHDGFGPQPRFFVLLAEVDGSAAGMALYFFNYSTWGNRNGLYLEDLYVDPKFRSQRVGRTLMVRLAEIAKDRGCGRFQWVVHSQNSAAIRLYGSVGAEMLEDWRLMSLKGNAIARLADET